eukprot:5565408-Pleurochrysis_carterae.AAC.1
MLGSPTTAKKPLAEALAALDLASLCPSGDDASLTQLVVAAARLCEPDQARRGVAGGWGRGRSQATAVQE